MHQTYPIASFRLFNILFSCVWMPLDNPAEGPMTMACAKMANYESTGLNQKKSTLRLSGGGHTSAKHDLAISVMARFLWIGGCRSLYQNRMAAHLSHLHGYALLPPT